VSEKEPYDELHIAWAKLSLQWTQSRAQWSDHVAAEFEREYWEQIFTTTIAIGNRYEELNECLDRAMELVRQR
jgi:hypothetical protein